MSEPRTSVWMVDFEVTAIEMHGHEWPDVLVQKWERNEIGERRFVESRMYSAADLALAADMRWSLRLAARLKRGIPPYAMSNMAAVQSQETWLSEVFVLLDNLAAIYDKAAKEASE